MLAACKPQEKAADSRDPGTNAAEEPVAEAPFIAKLPDNVTYTRRFGGVDNTVASERLQGSGPNKKLFFEVDYVASIRWTADERKTLGRRYCYWDYLSNGIVRTIKVVKSENNKEEVANGKRTQSGDIPPSDSTATNCNEVQGNTINPESNRRTSYAAWEKFVREDRPEVQRILSQPI